MTDTIPIVVDSRETNSGNITSLKRRKCKVEVKQLPYGDYIIGDMVIERKAGDDFIQSIQNKRLWSQVQNLTQAKIPILAVITDNIWKQMYFTRSNYIHKGYYSSLISLLTSYGIMVITFESEDDFLRFLKAAWKKLNKEKSASCRPAPMIRKATTMGERQENSLCAADKISVKTSIDILKHFGSLVKVANASAEDFIKIDGIGKAIAQNVYDMFHEKYEPPKKKKVK